MNLNVEIEDNACGSLLEFVANNDVQGVKRCIDREPRCVDEVGLWYGRRKSSSQMVLQQITPLMVAATYGCVDVLKTIISLSEVDVNQTCGADKSTALHYAASGGSVFAVDVVKLLLAAGADPTLIDANGRRPIDVIVILPKLEGVRHSLRTLLAIDGSSVEKETHLRLSAKANANANLAPEKKEYQVDPSLPDITKSVYSSDEFRMFLFKVRPCSRAYSHDWTKCPFVHPGENARRRDPRKYHYSCVPCPDFRKGSCSRGDMCEYAHGVFECWLHPAQYRTRLCKDVASCNRRVCFFAHAQEELRPLFVSTGSTVPLPRLSSLAAHTMDFVAAMNLGSPCSNVPALHLSGSNFQSSRLRLSLNARDVQSMLSQPSMLNHSGHVKTLTASNMEDVYSAKGSSPQYFDQALASPIFSPTHRSAVFNQSPIKTAFLPRNVDHSLMKSPFGSPSGRMSQSNLDPFSMLAHHENQHPWSNWGNSSRPFDWDVRADEQTKLKRSSSFEFLNNSEEPDLSWVQSLVKESPQDMKEKFDNHTEQVDQYVLAAFGLSKCSLIS